jgi:probable rRNA maturation factor
MTAKIEILKDCDPQWAPDLQSVNLWCTAALDLEKQTLPVNISLRLVDEEESRGLNRQFRGKDSATNVLSFPAGFPENIAQQMQELPLGDIVICPAVVEREATEQGKDLQAHWAHLLIHGVFHLIGYDHQNSDDAEIMENLEISALENLGITNPYLIG